VDSVQKVLWTEGMLLSPQHLQQADRYHEALLQRRLTALRPRGWGALRLQVNAEALSGGEFLLTRIAAVLPDGLSVDAPDVDLLPPGRPVEASFDPKKGVMGVHLAVARVKPGQPGIEAEGEAAAPGRWRRRTATLADESTGANEREIQTAAKSLRILFDGEPLEDYATLPVGRVTRSASGKFVLDEAFVPPCLSTAASPVLSGILRRVVEILSAKSAELAGQRRQRSQGLVEFTMSEAANFWFLHTVNATLPGLIHLHHAGDVHPEDVFLALGRLAGELTTFAGEGHPKDLPLYAHDAPGECFTAMEAKIRGLMETVIPSRCTAIPLTKARESLFTARLPDERLLDGAQFYLAVMAEVPEDKVAREVPLKAKISATDKVDQLIAAALRGIALRHLPTPPTEIPVQPGRTYFQVERAGDHWESVRASRTIAFYVPPEFKQLRLELMAVKA
jgi:type VI secretion system protein ImpJ